MKLFDRFDKVYCINLDRRPDRLESFNTQVEKYDLGDYTRISAVDGSKINISDYKTTLKLGELGLVLTNLQIIKDSKENGYNNILILEDDCSFTNEINIIQENEILAVHFFHHPELSCRLEHIEENKFLCTYSNPIYGIFEVPFKIEKDQVIELTLRSNAEFSPYIFKKKISLYSSDQKSSVRPDLIWD